MPGEALSESPSGAAAARSNAAPAIWLLLGNRAGDRAQVEALGAALGDALGWSVVPKPVVANGLFRIPNLVLGASLASIDRRASAALEPPWPALAIAAGRRAVPAALWVRRRSGGLTRLVHIGRPWAPVGWFDLVISTPQYALPSRPNVLLNPLPMSPIDAGRLDAAAAAWRPRLEGLPRPWTAVLVGGDARPYVLDPEAASRLAALASRQAGGGSLLVATGPRTPEAAAEALRRGLAAPCRFERWAPGGDNPYPAFLALADRLLVTGDSASMIAEACAAGARSGATVSIFDLPERPDLRLRLVRRLGRGARPGGLYERLVALGMLTSVRDMRRLHAAVYAAGLAAPAGADDRPAAGGTGVARPALPRHDPLGAAVARVRAMLESAGRGA